MTDERAAAALLRTMIDDQIMMCFAQRARRLQLRAASDLLERLLREKGL